MSGPISIREQGHFWTGVKRQQHSNGTYAFGAMSVQYQIPEQLQSPYSIVFIHGGGGQGCEFLSTPDGRPGWAQYFLSLGFAVYIVDRTGHGRSHFSAELGDPVNLLNYELVQDLFTHPKVKISGPLADLAKNWPQGDEVLDQFMAGIGPVIGSLEKTEMFARQAGAELLQRIGPSILITHSMGGPCGWVIADECPEFVKGIISIEPLGPPLSEPFKGLGALKCGVTASPLKHNTDQTQADNALKRIPISVVTGEASFMNAADPLTVEYLTQHGFRAEHIALAQHGIHGNGHFMIGETNSDDIAQLLVEWIKEKVI